MLVHNRVSWVYELRQLAVRGAETRRLGVEIAEVRGVMVSMA